MLASTRIREGRADVDILRGRLAVTDLDRLHGEVCALLSRRDVRTVAIGMRHVDFVDNSLVNVLRSLSRQARRTNRRLLLSSPPAALLFLASSSSHRLAWVAGLIPPDASSPTASVLGHRARAAERR